MKKFSVYLVVTCLSIVVLHSQQFERPFKYSQPLSDSINQSHLPNKTNIGINNAERITVKDGHFVNQQGERVKLLGSTLSYSACFPDSAVAVNLAKRFQELGINAVRFRGWDVSAPWGYLLPWQATTTDTVLNQVNIKKLDWFLYQLRKNGVYVFMNFNAFTPRQNDGVWRYDSINYTWNVLGIQYFHPSYQKAQRKFIKRVMNHVNQFSGVKYSDDPVIAMINFTDENSLSTWWSNNFSNGTTPLLCTSHRLLFDTLYNNWLKSRYQNDAGLKSFWSNGSVNTANILSDPGFEDAFSSPWSLSSSANAIFGFSDADKIEGSQSARVRIQTPGSNAYEIQLRQSQCKVVQGRQYKFTYWAKTSAQQVKRPISILLVRDNTPYDQLGLLVTDTLTAQWKQFSHTFICNTSYQTGLLIFGLGGFTGDVYLDNTSFAEETPTTLLAGESLTTFTVSSNTNRNLVSNKRIQSANDFVNETAINYYNSLTSMLKDTLKSKVLVSGNGISNSLSDIVTNKASDYTCATGYWGSFLSSFVDGKPWQMFRNPMTESSIGALLSNLSQGKQKNKPYILNNISQVYPSSNNLELLSMIPLYASYQDWDGIFFGEWCNDVSKLDSANITRNGWWEVKGQFNIHSLIPSISYMWRNSTIKPGEQVFPFNYSSALVKNLNWQTGAFYLPQYADNRIPYLRRIEVDSLNAQVQTFLPQNEIPELSDPNNIDMRNMISDTKQIHWNQVDGWVKSNTGKFISVTGKLNNGIISFDSTITIEKTDKSTYGAITWLSSDSLTIDKSPKSFLTLVSSRIQNQGAKWEGDSSLWQSWGKDFTEVEALSARFSLVSMYDTVIVYPLNAMGEKVEQPIIAQRGTNNKFRFTIDQNITKALWYSVEQRLSATPVYESYITNSCSVLPNPANDYCIIDFPESQYETTIIVRSLQGKLLKQFQPQVNSTSVQMLCNDLANGVYSIQVQQGTYTQNLKLVIHK